MKHILVLFFLLPVTGIAQTARVDSLKHLFAITTDKGKKMKLAFDLCEQRHSMNTDGLFSYASYAKRVATLKNDLAGVSMAEYYLTNCLVKKGLIDSALQVCNSFLGKLHYKDKNNQPFIRFSILKGQIFIRMSKYKEALEQFFGLLAEAETNADLETQQATLINIGWVKMEIGQDNEALKWFYDALKKRAGNSPNNASTLYINMSAIYNNLKQKDSALYYINKAVFICRGNEILQFLANALAVKASIFIGMKRIDLAEAPLKEAVKIRKLIGEPFYIVSDMMELGSYYSQTRQPEKGINICLEGIAIAEKNRLDSKLIILYDALAENYKTAGNNKRYEETLEKIISLKDCLYQKNSAIALAELQTKYDIQKQRNKIIQQNYDLARKNYFFYGLVALLCIVSIFSFILLRLNRKKQQLRLRMVNEENKRVRNIAVTTAKENERKRIAAELHDNLGGQMSYISSNMDFILDAPVHLSDNDKLDRLNEINQTAKNTIADLRETIWALKKEIIDFEELADKLKLYMQHQWGHKTNLQMEIKDNITTRPELTSVEALNIYRIFQEAINNAIKYAESGKIMLSITTNSEVEYNITLSDNGKGFDPAGTFPGHYGLGNMRERAGQIPAILNITSLKGKGTMISLTKLK